MRHSEAMKELIGVRVLVDEKRAITAMARQRGITLSEFIRETATEAVRRAVA